MTKVSSESEEDEEEEKNPRKRRREMSTDEKQSDLRLEDAWDADPSLCKVGAFAVIHSMYDTSFGMCIAKVQCQKKLDSVKFF